MAGIALSGPAIAQPGADPPVAGRPPQFSQIVGKYTFTATAAPTAVAVEEPITLRVRIAGQGPAKYQPKRKHLQIFPERFEERFYVEPVPDEDRVDPAAGSWEFVYRLRPKDARVRAIADLLLWTYDPALRKYQPRYADEIPITLTPRPTPTGADLELPAPAVPAELVALAPVAEVLAPPPYSPVFAAMGGAGLTVGLALAYALGVRALGQGATDDLTRARAAAARHALEALADGPPWVVTTTYLRARLAYPGEEPSPAEVAAFLKRRGLPRPLWEQARELFAACDAARFAPSPAAVLPDLRAAAADFIRAVEAAT